MKHCAAVVVFAALIWTARAADITGRVETISGETATIATEGTILPKAGDKVEIFFKLAGSDVEVSVATAIVVATATTTTTVKIDQATGAVAKGQLARIHSTSAPVNSPPPTPEPSRPNPKRVEEPVRPRPPSVLHECETYNRTICGTWTLVGGGFKARWENGATALLTIEEFGRDVRIRRTDTSSQKLTAIYTGIRSGTKIEGKVTWTSNGQSWSGTWNAEW